MTEAIKIQKRNGKFAEYDGNRIRLAISKAMVDSLDEVDSTIVDEIEEIISSMIYSEDEHIWTVDEISDEVENQLMEFGLKKVAKAYILYRNKRDEERKNEVHPYKFLSKEFISKYKHKPNPFPTQMSEFTYMRTYSRFIPELKRREYWWETVARVIEYNCSLAPNVSIKEAEQLFDNIYNLRQFPSGRSLWVANTPVSKKYPMSNFNCAFITVDDWSCYHEAFYLLLIGAGKGFRISKTDVEKLAPVRTDIELIDAYYNEIPRGKRKEHTELTFQNNIATITISDSKEGWVEALKLFIELHTRKIYSAIDTILIDYDNIRPKGEMLKTFGGYASGHESMRLMLNKISNVFKNSKGRFENQAKLLPIDALDIANILGENVVSGGVRRTAEIILFDEDDNDVINAKTNLYKQENGKWVVNQDIIHRQMSNNSIFYWSKPTREKLHWNLNTMRYSGEPGIINAEHGAKRRPNFNGVNACSEILLDSRGMCNLTEIVPLMFVREDGTLNEEGLYEAQKLSARMGYRMTMVDFEIHSWDLINKRDRLIGCSITGWQDFVNALNLSDKEQRRILRNLKNIAIEESEKYAKELGLNPPVLHTTNKPSGTISLLAGVSSGIHYSHSELYTRRIRISSNDPLANAMKDMGFKWYPEVGQTRENANTIVFEFPMKSPKGKTKYDVTAIEQLENYKMFMDEYSNHNVSCTVTVRDHEWEEVEEWVWNNWDSVIGISFLPLTDSMYELLPYESLTKEEYDEMCRTTPKFKPEVLQKYEKGEDFDILEADCVGGSCPVK